MKDTDTKAIPEEGKKKKSAPDDWEIKSWNDTVMEAHRIMKDPKKMKHVHKHMKGEHETIKSVQGLREKAKQVAAAEESAASEEAPFVPYKKKTTKKEAV